MPYNYKFTLPKYVVLRKYKRIIFILTLLLLFVVLCYLLFIWYAANENKIDRPQTDFKSKDFNPFQNFSTRYFSFETDKSWHFVPKESTSAKFVYRSSNKNIVKSDLIVYVNSLPRDLLVTHVLPVRINTDRFSVGDVSGHCRDYLKDIIRPGDNNPVEGVVDGVRVKCQVDGTSNTVVIGQVKGNYQVPLTGSNGKVNEYYIVYHDLEFMPQFAQFVNIAWSFRAK
ncbi:MAG TPA: hypothetical protein VFW77_03885 [Candidatus Saccharimonadales bacterium]|nr:hypothetical protein [Candidatus Saccharimonadales bacterium]